MKEELGDNEAATTIVNAIKAAMEQMAGVTETSKAAQARMDQVERENTYRTLNEFFSEKDLKPYGEFYGVGDSVSDEQFGNRSKVFENADALFVGARAQGRDITVQEALRLAHEIASADVKTTIIRDNLKKTAITNPLFV